MFIEAVEDMRAAVVRTLDEEADAENVAAPDVMGPDDVAELLESAKLIESGLREPLFDDRVEHACVTVGLKFALEVG